jgi:hypothetical protein
MKVPKQWMFSLRLVACDVIHKHEPTACSLAALSVGYDPRLPVVSSITHFRFFLVTVTCMRVDQSVQCWMTGGSELILWRAQRV